jgi:phage shock protein B
MPGIGVAKLAVILVFGIPIVAIVGWVIVEVAQAIFGRKQSGNGSKMSADDTQIIQEINRGLQRMEKRIEAVETIVLDKAAKEDEKVER